MRKRLYRLGIIATAVMLTMTSCVSGEKAVIREESESLIIEPVIETAEESYVIPVATVEDADEYVWSSILAMQNTKKAKEEAEAAVTEMPFEEPVEDTLVSEPVIEDSDAEIEEVKIVLPDVEILDTVEEEVEMIKAGVLGEDSAVSISSDDTAVITHFETESEGRILRGDITDDVSWLGTEEDTAEVSAAPINVSVYEYKEEETEDTAVSPEDILALSDTYRGDREEKKKVAAMDKTEIVTLAVTWLSDNYRYILLGVIILLVIILVKVLAKNLKKGTKKKKEKIEGPEFSEDQTVAINIMEQGNISSFMQEPQEKAEPEKNTPEEEKLKMHIRQEEDGTTILTGSDEYTVEDSIRLAAMGISSAYGADDI